MPRNNYLYTAEHFLHFVGHPPEQDDLDRANCPYAGSLGHQDCGVCVDHKKPIFCCPECWENRPVVRLNLNEIPPIL